MAQQPNPNGDGANGNAPQQQQQQNDPSELGAFLQQLQGVTLEKLQPLVLTKGEMNRMKLQN